MRGVVVLACVVVLNQVAWAEALDCSGVVWDERDRPVANATVVVYTARVKEGTSPYCPSCYADCGKQARTDKDGHFVIRALNTELRFQLLALAEGRCSTFVSNVDPGDQGVRIVLSSLPADRLAPSHIIRGRVVGPDGHPVLYATIEPSGVPMDGLVRAWARPCLPDEVDPLAITNEKGEFLLTVKTPDLAVWVTVRAPGMAACAYRSLKAGATIQEIKMTDGCTVKGRLARDGTAVKGAVIGVAQTDRGVGEFLGEYTTGLREDGGFEICNLPPNTEYYVYGKMESLQGQGAVSVRAFCTGEDGSAVDLGDLTLDRGHQVSGQVALSDGGAIPAHTRLLILRTDAWDTLFCELDKDGRFAARDVPAGKCQVSVRVNGYGMSPRNKGFAVHGRLMLEGTVDKDIEKLTVLMEPYKETPAAPSQAVRLPIPVRRGDTLADRYLKWSERESDVNSMSDRDLSSQLRNIRQQPAPRAATGGQ